MLALVDFRKGSLTGEGGFDSVSGSGAAITETDTGVGVYAADWTSDASNYGVVAISTFDENWVYAYIILDSAPASDLTVLQLLQSSTAVGEIVINSSQELELKENGSQIGSASSALTLGTLYRIGLRQKVGTGADAELEGYLGERHATLTSFASAANRTFTAQADELRVGAIDAVALDARIGYVAASERGWPASWLDLHDVVIGEMGFMAQGGPRLFASADMVPAHDRAALGERRHDTFQTMSFISQANFAGGVGQSRLISADRILTGIADTRFTGYAFPPRARQNATSTGGTTSWYFNRGSTLYGTTASNFEQINSANTVAHGGAPAHAPVVDGNNNVYWATSSNTVRKYDGSSVTNITPGSYSIKHVAHYGRHIFAIATLPVTAGLTNDTAKSYPATGSNIMPSLSITPIDDPGTIVFCTVEVFHATDTTIALSSASSTAGWTAVPSTPVTQGSQALYSFYHVGGGTNAKTISIDVTSTDALAIAHMVEFSGFDPDDSTGLVVGTQTGTGSSPLTATAASAGDFQFAATGFENTASNINVTPESQWTELQDIHNTNDSQFAAMWRNASDSSATFTYGASMGDTALFNISIPETSRTGSRLVILASDDEGQTWTAAPANFSMDLFGTIRASVATANALWITSDRGLFRMVAQANETLGGDDILDVGITQQDRWELPADDNAGKWIASFQGLLYYPVGATIRRYAPNSQDPNDDRAFWPPEDWATKADQVQALVSNEGGIWWGSSGYLWNFNGRGFHQMAAEPTANDFDYLYWHQGNLYINTDPADYYKYHYVNVRPDILIANGDLDQDDFATGYLITSSLDFEKVADPKIIRLFESQVSFTQQASTSGNIDIHYRLGCGTNADPGVGSGGDTGSSWVSVGDHDYDDGGYKRHVLTTPLQCYRMYTRITLTPGSGGIPVMHFITVWGQSIMPPVQRVVAQITANVGQVNREGKLMWGSAAEVKKALRVIKGWRGRVDPVADTLYHYVSINDGTDGGDEFLCTFAQLEYALSGQSNDENRTSWDAALSFEELPQ